MTTTPSIVSSRASVPPSVPAHAPAPVPDRLPDPDQAGATSRFGLDDIAFPPPQLRLGQDDEWAVVRVGDAWRRVRLHDYNDVFAIPGLYDLWVYEILHCKSPRRIRDLLGRALKNAGVAADSLTALDLGAGNGCVAEELAALGIKRFVGVDIAPMARVAAERDRPGRYLAYVVDDLTQLAPESEHLLDQHRFNALTCVAALGFGDIPPAVFTAALRRLEPGAWVAFTLKSEFVQRRGSSAFADLVHEMERSGDIEIVDRETYVHRIDAAGEPLEYTGFIARTSS